MCNNILIILIPWAVILLWYWGNQFLLTILRKKVCIWLLTCNWSFICLKCMTVRGPLRKGKQLKLDSSRFKLLMSCSWIRRSEGIMIPIIESTLWRWFLFFYIYCLPVNSKIIWLWWNLIFPATLLVMDRKRITYNINSKLHVYIFRFPSCTIQHELPLY